MTQLLSFLLKSNSMVCKNSFISSLAAKSTGFSSWAFFACSKGKPERGLKKLAYKPRSHLDGFVEENEEIFLHDMKYINFPGVHNIGKKLCIFQIKSLFSSPFRGLEN